MLLLFGLGEARSVNRAVISAIWALRFSRSNVRGGVDSSVLVLELEVSEVCPNETDAIGGGRGGIAMLAVLARKAPLYPVG